MNTGKPATITKAEYLDAVEAFIRGVMEREDETRQCGVQRAIDHISTAAARIDDPDVI